MATSDPPVFNVTAVDLFERDVRLRLPFHFGATTLRKASQAFVRATIRERGGRESVGWTAEMMVPGWFDKRPGRAHPRQTDDLRSALGLARGAYASDRRARTAFGHAAYHHPLLVATGAERDLNPLIVSYGAALVDRAILDAVCRAQQASFLAAVRANLFGLDASLTPDLANVDFGPFLARCELPASIAARHTIGLDDPLDANEIARRPSDDLPVSLDEVIARYGYRHFKIKLSGVVEDDLERLARIARSLGELHGYAVTLDGNEQFHDADAVYALWRAMRGRRPLARLVASVLYLEQPLSREATLSTDVHALAHEVRLMIDEADDRYDAFLDAQGQGYHGVSSKNCKGVYKSLINAMRCAAAPTRRLFLSGEDLTAQCGLAVQQDLALAGALGLTHVERNGHHYVAGFAGQGAKSREQAAFATAHRSLYAEGPGGVRLAVRGGRIALDSLDVTGFASAVLPAPDALAAMRVPEPSPAGSSR
jgi:hypothetical protein